MPAPSREPRWTDALSDEDLAFVKRFVLASGSLKALAAEYGISYPTVRLRLDRLIEKVRVLDDASITDGFERRARALFAEGRIDRAALSELIEAHRAAADEKDRDKAEDE